MDTISSRESNTNYLPLAGVIAGVAALLLAIFAFVKISSLRNEVAELKGTIEQRVNGVETQVSQVANTAQQMQNTVQAFNRLQSDVSRNATGANNAFAEVSNHLTEIRGRLDKLESSRTASRPPAQQGGATATQAPVAGADEYVVKSGDTGSKIAAAHGIKLGDLLAVNPDVDWTRMRPGQKIKLPKK